MILKRDCNDVRIYENHSGKREHQELRRFHVVKWNKAKNQIESIIPSDGIKTIGNDYKIRVVRIMPGIVMGVITNEDIKCVSQARTLNYAMVCWRKIMK